MLSESHLPVCTSQGLKPKTICLSVSSKQARKDFLVSLSIGANGNSVEIASLKKSSLHKHKDCPNVDFKQITIPNGHATLLCRLLSKTIRLRLTRFKERQAEKTLFRSAGDLADDSFRCFLSRPSMWRPSSETQLKPSKTQCRQRRVGDAKLGPVFLFAAFGDSWNPSASSFAGWLMDFFGIKQR